MASVKLLWIMCRVALFNDQYSLRSATLGILLVEKVAMLPTVETLYALHF